MRSVVFLLCLLASSSYAASPFFNAKVTGASSGGSSGPINTSNIVVDTATASNTQVLYASGTTIDGAQGLNYDRIQNRVTVGTPTAATPVFGDTLRVSGTQTVTGVLTVGSCVGCGGAGSGTPISTSTFTPASNISNSTAIGFNAYPVGTGANNTVFGAYSGYAVTSGVDNIYIGSAAGQSATTATRNVLLGSGAGMAGLNGGSNVAIGYHTGFNSTGSQNVFVGGSNTTGASSGNSNILVGYNISPNSSSADNQLSIGNAIIGYLGSNQNGHSNDAKIAVNVTSPTANFEVSGTVALDSLTNSAGTGPLCYSTSTKLVTTNTAACTVSDIRFKKNIASYDGTLDKVMQLKVRQFDFKDKAYGKLHQVGLIAQEVEPIIPAVVGTGDDGYKSISYDKLSVYAIGAIQEQQREINDIRYSLGMPLLHVGFWERMKWLMVGKE